MEVLTDTIIRTKEGKWENSDVFRQEAIRFKKYGYFCSDYWGTPGWQEYWEEQLERCKNGYTIGGESITGHHYMYLNFCQIQVVIKIEGKKASRKVTTFPDFWDGDYDYFWSLEIARNGITPERLEDLNLGVKPHPDFLMGGFHMIVGKSRRKGYQQPYSEIVMTPDGYSTMGEIKVGDEVLSPTGVSKVLEKYEQGESDVYELTLYDGRKVKCGLEHLWKVFKPISRKGYRQEKIVNTEHLLNTELKTKKGYQYYLPFNEEVVYTEKNVPIPSYTMGVILGDGNVTKQFKISGIDQEIFDNVLTELNQKYDGGYEIGSTYQANKMLVFKTDDIAYWKEYYNTSKFCYSVNPVYEELKREGLNCKSSEKFIPEVYKTSSVKQRYDLVKGLMDTDGFISQDGAMSFGNVSKRLVKDLQEVLYSLGISSVFRERLDGLFIIYINTDIDIFSIKRKSSRVKPGRESRKYIAIIDIKKLDYKENSACILLDSEDHLYLTRDYIVTHNSYKNGAISANYYNTERKAQVIIGASEKKFLYPKGTMGMTSDYLNFLNEFTGWRKSRDYVDKQDHKKASFKKKINGVDIESGYQSEVFALTFKDNSDAARGKDGILVLLEEAGAFPNLKASYAAIKPALTAGVYITGQIVIFGCVAEGTKVYTSEGEVKSIEDIEQVDGILGYDGEDVNSQDIVWQKIPIEKECIKITTSSGNILTCSVDHPILMTTRKAQVLQGIKKSTYTCAKDLKINDQLLKPSSVSIFGKKDVPYSRELGLLIGDGNYSLNTTPSLSVADNDILDYMSAKYKCNYSKKYTISEEKQYRQIMLPELKGKLLIHQMRGQSKQEKRLPFDRHTFNKESLSNLLGGYFDADGNVYYNKKKKIVRVVLTSVVKPLLEQVKYELLKFGVHCSIYKENRNTKPEEGYQGQQDHIYRLYINRQEDIVNFKNNISFLIKEKQKKLTLTKYSKYQKIKTWFKVNKDNKKKGYFKKDILGSLRYETVTKLEFVGKKKVFNLNCTDNHNYLASGLITRQTGGDMESGTADFADMFYNPVAYGIQPFVNTWDDNATETMCGYFHPVVKNLEGFYDLQGNSDLETALKFETGRRKNILENSNNSTAYQQHIQEFALKPSEAFLTVSTNDFPVVELRAQLNKVTREKLMLIKGTPVTLGRHPDDKKKILAQPDLINKLNPIINYKVKEKDLTGCPIIFEFPSNPPKGLYKIGYDPYRQDQSAGVSLAAVYVYKTVQKGNFSRNIIVATYVGRPQTTDSCNRIVEMLAELYNAEIMYENEVPDVKKYFERRRKLHLLAAQPDGVISKNIKNSRVARVYGCHMNEKLKDAGAKYIKQWLLEERDFNENGEVLTNMDYIFDIGLLEELILYNKKGNFDRVMALMQVLFQVEEDDLDKEYGDTGEQNKSVTELLSLNLFNRN